MEDYFSMSSQSDLDIINSVIERDMHNGLDYDAVKLTDEDVTYTYLAPLSEGYSDAFNTTVQSEQTTFNSNIMDEFFTQNNIEQATLNQGIDTFITSVQNDQPSITSLVLDDVLFTQTNAEQVNGLQGVDNSLTNDLPNFIGDIFLTPNATDVAEASDVMTPVSPKEVFGEEAPKKRGRKRKSDESQPPSRRQRAKKPKAYERETPFEDEEMERRRKNAQNAKKHRDKQKEIFQEMVDELAALRKEKDALEAEVEKMRLRESKVMQMLQFYQRRETTTAAPTTGLIIKVLPPSPELNS